MHTNLFLVLRDALADHKEGQFTLRLVSGDLTVATLSSVATKPEGPLPGRFKGASQKVSAAELELAFASDPTPLPSEKPGEVPLEDRIGAELRAYLSKPLGAEALAKVMVQPDHPVTGAVLKRAEALQTKLDAGEKIAPSEPVREPLVSKVRLQDLLRGLPPRGTPL